MKIRLLIIVLAAMAVSSCYRHRLIELPSRMIPCDVNPDEVFGAHYTAADFQIWPMADDSMAGIVAGRAVREKGISSASSGWQVMFDNADTAEVGSIARDLCASHRTGDTVCCYGWVPEGFDSSKSVIVFVCGTAPLIDGTSVANAGVELMWDEPNVLFEFAQEHHSDWQRITRDNVMRCLPIMLGGRMLAAPWVNAEIAGGKCSLSGLKEEECCAIAAILTAGKGPESPAQPK